MIRNLCRAVVSLFASALICLAAVPPAQANTSSAVGGPNVDKGKTIIEYRLAGSLDDDSASQDRNVRTRVHIDHAFSDIYAARLVYVINRAKGDNFEADGISWQNRFHLIKKEQYGFDGGIRLNYTLADGDKEPDEISLRFYQQIPLSFPAKGAELRFNQIFEHEMGDQSESGLIAEWRNQWTVPLGQGMRFGFDSFHDFDNLRHQSGWSAQKHAIGPVFKAKFADVYSLEAAYRAGLSTAAPDHSVTFIINRSW
jgi:hypothetical protein